MTLKNAFYGLSLLIGIGLVNFFITISLFNPLHNNGITEIEDYPQRLINQLQQLSQERLELQQEHLHLLKQHRKLQQNLIDGELQNFREEIFSVTEELKMTRKGLERINSPPEPPREQCGGILQEIDNLQKATEVYFGFRERIDGGITESAKKLTRNVVDVPRVDGNSLSFEQFYRRYEKTRTPVVITNYAKNMFSQNWTLNFISSYCGSEFANLHYYDPNHVAWGNLQREKENTQVSTFIESVKDGTSGNHYLFDWSITNNCPRILDDTYTVPKFFSSDFFQRVPDEVWGEDLGFKNGWPSLFIGTGNTASGLHVDAVQSHFWMAMISGRKRWAVVTPDEVPFLYPHPKKATFLIGDIFNVNLQEYPLVSKATIWETVLEPGDIIFVPGGSAHQIKNLDTIISISMNFIDSENIDRAIPLIESRHPGVANLMASKYFERGLASKQKDLPWRRFKTWPRNDEVYDLH